MKRSKSLHSTQDMINRRTSETEEQELAMEYEELELDMGSFLENES